MCYLFCTGTEQALLQGRELRRTKDDMNTNVPPGVQQREETGFCHGSPFFPPSFSCFYLLLLFLRGTVIKIKL